MLKLRIFYEKRGWLKYIGHRDWLNFLQRAIKRAKLPVLYTSGYSPRIKLNFSPALPLGIESVCEYFDIILKEWLNKEDIVKKMEKQIFSEVRIKKIVYLPEGKNPNPYGCIYKDEKGKDIVYYFGEKKHEFKNKSGVVRVKFLYNIKGCEKKDK